MRKGERLNFNGMRCVTKSTYTREIQHKGKTVERLLWRYTFSGPSGERFVYTGVYLGEAVQIGGEYDFKATVKQDLNDYGYIRLQRIAIREVPQQGSML